ncbi:hypothetical protein FLK61_26230 [Paenalkalicoccus suaedae]|uniref:Uncharacterized protein n=1 Tax=Paenalkalicoccus suaedae TaxID=2592382 RepID=A0A859FBZ6_9BACI|nr:hypothetical protein [Paenalkalicoccus suaedae]QKS70261.1 hypothetical protein FLK61_26230 [Paenalkalicoccus suaedae]
MDAMSVALNIAKVGRVSSISGRNVSVVFEDRDNLVTDPLPMLNNLDPPPVGSSVLCIFLGSALDEGFCLGTY